MITVTQTRSTVVTLVTNEIALQSLTTTHTGKHELATHFTAPNISRSTTIAMKHVAIVPSGDIKDMV